MTIGISLSSTIQRVTDAWFTHGFAFTKSDDSDIMSAVTAGGSNVGDGVPTITADGALRETWTATCTAEAADAGTFEVVGSVSGVIGNVTVDGAALEAGGLSVAIADGATDFDIGDSFTWQTAGLCNVWVGAAGNVNAVLSGGDTVLLTGHPVGVQPFLFKRVLDTSTVPTALVAVWRE